MVTVVTSGNNWSLKVRVPRARWLVLELLVVVGEEVEAGVEGVSRGAAAFDDGERGGVGGIGVVGQHGQLVGIAVGALAVVDNRRPGLIFCSVVRMRMRSGNTCILYKNIYIFLPSK